MKKGSKVTPLILDSCALLEILWYGKDAESIASFLTQLQDNSDVQIVVPQVVLLECSNVIAVRYKEGKIKGALKDDIRKLFALQPHSSLDVKLSQELVFEAALIKKRHAASMIDCFLLALASKLSAQILTADSEILQYQKKFLTQLKVGKSFCAVSWE